MAKIDVRGAIPSLKDAQTYGQNYDRPWYEDVAEVGRQGLGGLADIGYQYGQALRAVSPEDSEAEDTGRRIARYAQEWQQRLEPNTMGETAISGTLAKGLRGVVAATPSIGATILGTPAAGAAVSMAQYGLSSGQDTYDKLTAQGVSHEDALQAAFGVGGIQGAGEGLATYATGGLYRAVRPAAGAAMSAIAGQAVDTRVVMPYAKEVLKNLFIQPTTEAAQDVSSSLVERSYGAAPEDLVSMAKESAQGGLGMTVWMSLLGIPGAAGRAKAAQLYNYALHDPNAPEELRAQAIDAVTSMAKEAKVSPDAIAQWVAEQNAGVDMKSGNEVDLLAGGTGLDTRPRQSSRYLPDTAFTQPDQQRDLFNTRGGQQTTPGEQIDLFGAVGDQTAPTVQVDESQGDLFAPQPAQFQTRMTADMLDGVGLPRQSAYYRQLVGKDMSAPDAQQQVSAILTRVRQDPNISERTKSGMESLAMQAFGALARQQEMFGPKGGAYPAGKPSTQITLPGQPQNLLPTQTAAEAGYVPAAAEQTVAPEQTMAPQVTPEQMMRPELPAGAQLTPEQTRKFKQAQALYDMADTDAERRAVGSIMQGIIDTVAPTAQTTEQVSPPSVPAAAASPSAPVAEGTSSTQENVPQATETVQAEAQGQKPAAELSPADQQQLQKLLDESEASDTKNVLPASVTSSGKAVPGKTRLNQVALASIRDALVKGKETASPITQRIVDALNNFASAYKVYSDEGGQAVSRRDSFGKKTTAEQYAEKSAEKIQLHAANVQAALAELGDAVGGNAKDVEAVVKLVKSMVQGKVATPGKTRSEVIQQLRQLDTMLSQAWGAAKREVFRTEGAVDTADIRTQSVRASQELQAKGEKSPLVTVANDGIYAGKDNGTLYGLPAILHYMRKHGTPMERVLATALRETLVGQEGDLKLKFIKEGNAHFDPKTNTVFLRENESPEVTLHEAFHAALQSFVYKNPTHPAVVQLKKSLKSVLNYKGELTGKAKEVQSLLAKLSSEGKELDAVLELVSYGTTLNEFRKALQEMKADPKAPKSFVQSMSRAWEAIKQIATRLLGGKRTLANDVLESSLELLDKARKQTPVVGQGNVLEASVAANTSAFRRWFGGSQVVDARGAPLVVYHGSKADIDTFQAGTDITKAMYFTASPEMASTYATGYARGEGAPAVYPVYLSAKKLLNITAGQASSGGVIGRVARLFSPGARARDMAESTLRARLQSGMFISAEDIAALKRLGYDGVYSEKIHGKTAPVYAVFDANQIKSAVGNRGTYDASSGNILEAAVTSDTKYSPKESAQLAMDKYAEGPGWAFNITRSALESVGFGEGGRIDKALSAKMEKTAIKIAQQFPNLAKNLRNISSTFGLTLDYKEQRSILKQEKQTGLIEAEALLKGLYRRPVDAIRVFTYLNGNKDAIGTTGKDARLRDMADAINEHFDTYIQSLAPADRRLFEGLKFTDKLLKPERLADLAKKSFGMHSVQAIFKPESRNEATLDEFKALLPMKDGSVDTDAPLYQTFEVSPITGQRVPNGFVGDKIADAHPELDVDRSRLWYYDGVKNKEHVFKTRNISGKNLLDVANRLADPRTAQREKDEAIQQISSALLTTMAALSHNAATKNFFGGLLPMGREENGEATARTVVFDSVDEINKVFPGAKITDDQLLKASDDESKIKHIRSVAQRGDVWVKLPDTDHYGDMAGKIISGGVWSDMLDMHDRSPMIKSELINDMLSAFKKNKTVFSPATHANNILTNYALMLLHGISHKALGDAARMMWRYELNPANLTEQERAVMKAFYKSGSVLGQFTNAETKSYLAKRLEQSITQQNDRSVLDKLLAWGKFEKEFADYALKAQRVGKLSEDAVSELYAAGDNVFRLAAFMKVAGTLQAKNNGALSEASLQEAGRAARNMFLDYDIDARWVRAARQSALPFISWSYAIMPVLGRLAVTRPWAMVNMMAALYAMGAMGGDDEWRKKGPDAVRERSLWGMGPYNMVRLPFMGTDENPVYWNIGKSIPMMSLFEPPMGETKLFHSNYIPGAVNPSGPYVTLIGSLLFNTDPFTGKPVTTEADTGFDKFGKYSAAVWDTFAPSPLTTHLWKNVKKDWNDTTGPTGKGMDSLYLARLFGLTIYEYDMAEAKFYQDAEVKAIKRDFSMAITKAKRDEMAKGAPDYEALDEEVVKLRERLQKRIAEIRGEE